MESNENQKSWIMSKEKKIIFWALWIFGIFFALASICSSTATAILYCSQQYSLKNYWKITGLFNKESSLMFLLESPELDDACNSYLLSFIKIFLFRKKLDKDLLALKNLFFEYAQDIRKHEEISINQCYNNCKNYKCSNLIFIMSLFSYWIWLSTNRL